MPTTAAKKRAQTKKKQGKAASTQAGEFVRDEMRKLKGGKGNAKSRRKAVAIGLSEARRSGVKLKSQPRSKRQSTSGRSGGSASRAKSTTTRRSSKSTKSRTNRSKSTRAKSSRSKSRR